jgi:DNA-directed RNA polymerase subunit RPC12/RpoP
MAEEMEKLGVVTNPPSGYKDGDVIHCPKCSSLVVWKGKVTACPGCGTEPFEVKHGRDGEDR